MHFCFLCCVASDGGGLVSVICYGVVIAFLFMLLHCVLVVLISSLAGSLLALRVSFLFLFFSFGARRVRESLRGIILSCVFSLLVLLFCRCCCFAILFNLWCKCFI